MSSSRQRLPVLPRQLLNSYSQVARWTSDCPQTHVWRPTEDYHPGTFPFPPAPLRAAAALQTARCAAGNPPPPPRQTSWPRRRCALETRAAPPAEEHPPLPLVAQEGGGGACTSLRNQQRVPPPRASAERPIAVWRPRASSPSLGSSPPAPPTPSPPKNINNRVDK